MQNRKVLVSQVAIDVVKPYLEKHNCEVIAHTKDVHVSKALEGCAAFFMFNAGGCFGSDMDNKPELKVISLGSAGTNFIDVEGAKQRGITVTYAPGANARSVGEHTIALILACIKKIISNDSKVRDRSAWLDRFDDLNGDFYGKKLGLIGCGNIGAYVVKMASAFDVECQIYDPFAKTLPENATRVETLDELYKTSDIISIHVPLTEKTKSMIGKKEFEMMKDDAILINCARGPVVNEKDLYEALKNKVIAAAGIDVYEVEPLPKDSKLSDLDNVVFSAHKAAFTKDTLERMWLMGAQGIVEVLDGKAPSYPV